MNFTLLRNARYAGVKLKINKMDKMAKTVKTLK